MLDKTDFVSRTTNKSKKQYRAFCNICGADRGYLNDDGSGMCYKCAIKERNENLKISPAPNDDFITTTDGNRYYRTVCPICGGDRGYLRKSATNQCCGSCASKARNASLYPKDPIKEAHRKLRSSMKGGISRKLRLRQLSKSNKSVTKILPYTLHELMTYIESLWQPGMSWDNYGEWEIDHVIPDSWFIYSSTDDEGFQNSWALTNLQPLLKIETRHKSNRFA